MADELLGVELRLERAHEHIHALTHEARMFMMNPPQPYDTVTELDSDGIHYVTRARIIRLPPMRMGMIVADAVHNLRSALDMIAWQLALAGPNPPPDDDTATAFPICTHPDAWEGNHTQRMIERIPDYAVQMIKSFQPYNRPNGLLRLGFVQAFDNWAKHKTIPGLFSFHTSRIRPTGPYEIIEANIGAAFEDGDVICRSRPLTSYPQERFRAYFMCHVSFAKVGPGQGYPLELLDSTYEDIRNKILPAFKGFFPDYE